MLLQGYEFDPDPHSFFLLASNPDPGGKNENKNIKNAWTLVFFVFGILIFVILFVNFFLKSIKNRNRKSIIDADEGQ